MVVKVVVIDLKGEKMEIDLCDTEEQLKSITVLQLKEKILERKKEGGSAEYMRLIYTHKLLDEDSAPLSAYGIQHMSLIQMILRIPGGSTYPWTGDGGMGDKGGKNRTRRFRLLDELEHERNKFCEEARSQRVIKSYRPKAHKEAEPNGAQQLATNSTKMGKIYKVVVHGYKGEKMFIDLCDTEEEFKSFTVLQLKEKIRETLHYDTDSDFRLIFTDRILDEDSALLTAYGIQHLSVIHVVMRVTGGGCPPGKGDGGMGDKDGKNRSMETLTFF